MDKESVLAGKIVTVETKMGARSEINPDQAERSSQIKEAVARSVREYGETLKKLAKDD